MQRQNVSIAALVDYPMFSSAINNFVIPSMRELGFTTRTTVIDHPDLLLNESLRMRMLSDFDVFFIHSNYGAMVKIQGRENNSDYLANIERQRLNCPGLISQIHEVNQYARIIVTSGIYPDGIKSCLDMKADGYIDIIDFFNPIFKEELGFIIDIIAKGKLDKEELKIRGEDLQMLQEDRERYNFRFEEWNSNKGQNLNYV